MQKSFFCRMCRVGVGSLCERRLLPFFVACVTAITFPVMAQVCFEAEFRFDNVRSGEGGRSDPTPLPEVEGLRFSPFRAVPAAGNPYGMSEHPSSKEVFSFKGWPVYEAADAGTWSIDTTQYYEFGIVPEQGMACRVDSITFKIARTATAPTHYALRSSIDGFSSNLNVVPVKEDEDISIGGLLEIVFSDKESEYKRQLKSVLCASVTGKLVFRFYAWRGEKQNAPFKLDEVSVVGSVYRSEEDVTDSSEVDVVTKRFPSAFMEAWQTTVAFRGSGVGQTFHCQLQLPRASFEAVSALVNLNVSEPLHLQDVSIEVLNGDSVDVASRFQVQYLLEKEIPPQSVGTQLLRIAPRWRVTDPEDYTLQGALHYIDPSDAQPRTAVLYPTTVGLKGTAWYSTDCFIPTEGGMPVVFLVRNESAFQAEGVRLVTGEGDRAETVNPEPFSAGNTCCLVSDLLPDSLLIDRYSCAPDSDVWSPDTLLSSAPVLHRLVQFVSLREDGPDVLAGCLADDAQAGGLPKERIYSVDGKVIPVSQASRFRYDNPLLPARDSVAFFTRVQQEGGWNHARVFLPLSMQYRRVRSVTRLSDGRRIPRRNAWTDLAGHLHLVDTVVSEEERYRVSFTGLDLKPVVTEFSDSICLGDGYRNHGFELPPFTESGDYVFVDSLVAWSGADSLAVLRLNVCPIPSRPGIIVGDSVVVRAGNYFYTISPVPEPAVYIWSVFPSDWQLTGSGETVSLNVPYAGKGVLSVRAVNRCGTSEASSLNITSEMAGSGQESRPEMFVVYPDDNEGDFILETDGLEGKTVIAVSDLSGRVICSMERELSGTDRTVRFSLKETPSGMYIISIVNKNEGITQKLRKE